MVRRSRPLKTFAHVVVDFDRRRVVITRTAEPYASIDEVKVFWNAIHERLHMVQEGHWDLLTDLRQVQGRNDEAFEKVMEACRRPIYDRFRRSAVIVRSAVGRMQIARHTRADAPDTRIFNNLADAETWLSTRARR